MSVRTSKRRSSPIPGSMPAAVYRGRGRLGCEEVPVPPIEDGEILVEIDTCGVCPTDLKKVDTGRDAPPRIYGHEMAGIVAATHSRRWREGDRVVAYHHTPCRMCPFCRRGEYAQCPFFKKTGTTAGFEPAGGGMARYVRALPWVARDGIVPVPRGVPLEEAALMEPVNTCLKALRTLRLEGGTVWIAGLGAIGLTFVQLAREEKLRVIGSDPIVERREKGKRMGAAQTFAPDDAGLRDALRSLPGGGPDAAIVTAPLSKLVAEAIDAVRPCGTVVPFGHTQGGVPITVDGWQIGVGEKRLVGSYSSDPDLYEEVASLLARRAVRMGDLITHRLPLERCAEAFDLVRTPSPGVLKVLVKPGGVKP